ncbi:macrophage colony-stimulating factor 1 isoform X2 [Rhinatrema bivittatum]|uniref:macrophage colony-stimulating factor 1 isoform X2 n=1 Tax=Rhinatrema bivittatum TaxID=194408 RepID=UPI00112EE4A4|nr:macrophage colony-stimulating factor 1 isoform X2 [Rhinatrema bivittatum]
MFSCCSVQFMLLLFMVHQLQATENISCKNAITDRHLQFMDELIDSQLQSSCKITFDFVDPVQLTDDVCYIQAAFELLNEVFNTHMKFKKGSLNFNNTEEMKNLFDELLYEDCIPTLDKGCCKQCAMTFTMSHQEMLEMVKVVFLKSQKLLQNTTIQMKKNCMEEIAQCRRAQQPPPSGKQGREMAQTESQSKVFLSCVLPMLAGLLLVLCGLLYYRHKSKNLKQTLERMSRETEPEERPLNGQLVELQVQGIV